MPNDVKKRSLFALVIAIASCPTQLLGQGTNPWVLSHSETGTIDHRLASKRLCGIREYLDTYPDTIATLLGSEWSKYSVEAKRLVGAQWYLLRAEANAKGLRMEDALADCDSAKKYAEVVYDANILAEIDLVLAQVTIWAGDYDRASQFLEGALTHFAKTGKTNRVADCNREIGWVFYRQRRYGLAMERYRSALKEYLATGNSSGAARIYTSMGLVASDSYGDKTNTIGLAYFDSALALARPIEDHSRLAAAHSNIGAVHMYMDILDVSKAHFDSALHHAELAGDARLIASVEESIGEYFLHTPFPEKALKICEEAGRAAKANGMLALERDALLCVYNAQRLMGDHETALQSLWKYFVLKDSVVSVQSRDNVLMRSVQAEAYRKQFRDSVEHAMKLAQSEGMRLRAELEGERRLKQVLVFGVALPVILALGLIVLIIDRRRRQSHHSRDAAVLNMKVLRTQMNPHFIFNALNSINHYVQENERDLASGFLTKFARLMRLVLESSRHDEVPLAEDLEALRIYMELEQSRMNGKFDYSIEVDAAIDQAETMVPPLVLQPFVENAIWHGISRKEGKGYIKLIVRKYPDRLTMSVEDDGVGRGSSSTHPPPDGASPKASLGTTITQDRLSLLGKQRGGEAGFRFMDLEQGTRVEVELPI